MSNVETAAPAGRAVLVLGGGGVKGLTHLGAWKAVRESGLEVVEIVGTSIGALVGACIAGGASWSELVDRAAKLRKRDIVSLNFPAFFPNGIREASVFRATALQAFIRATLPVERFEDLTIPVSMNAVDLETGVTEWFGAAGRVDVSLADAIYASCALPLFYPPAVIDDRHYVDGGVVNSLAVDRAAAIGAAGAADVVVAVDASAGQIKDPLDTVDKGLVAIHHRVYDIMASELRRRQLDAWNGPPLIHVRPRLDGYSTFDFASTRYFVEEGYRATRQALAEAIARQVVHES